MFGIVLVLLETPAQGLEGPGFESFFVPLEELVEDFEDGRGIAQLREPTADIAQTLILVAVRAAELRFNESKKAADFLDALAGFVYSFIPLFVIGGCEEPGC